MLHDAADRTMSMRLFLLFAMSCQRGSHHYPKRLCLWPKCIPEKIRTSYQELRRFLLFQMSYRDISLSLSWCTCRLCASTFHSSISTSKLTISCTITTCRPRLNGIIWDTTLNRLMLAKDEQMLAWPILDWWYMFSWNLDHFVFLYIVCLKIATGSTRNSVIHFTRMAPYFSATVANVIGYSSIHHKCQ